METQIRDALISLLAAIKAADGQRTTSEMARIEELVDRGRAGLHPQLVHFLQNRSYAKALQFVGGDSDVPAGACGGRPPPVES